MVKRNFTKAAVIGGTSEIALSIIKNLPSLETVWLVGRDETRLNVAADSLKVAEIKVLAGDISSGDGITCLASRLPEDLDLVIIAQGMLRPSATDGGYSDLDDMIRVNLAGPCFWMDTLVRMYEHIPCRICVISSVAGDRGRASNYLYGMTKSGLSAYSEGLASSLFQRGALCRITLLKPGLVATRMTADRTDMRLAAGCDSVGRSAARALMAGRETVYVPGWWRVVMFAVRCLPAFIFHHIRA